MESIVCALCGWRNGGEVRIPGKYRLAHADWHWRGCRTREEFGIYERALRDAAGYGAVGNEVAPDQKPRFEE